MSFDWGRWRGMRVVVKRHCGWVERSRLSRSGGAHRHAEIIGICQLESVKWFRPITQ